MSGAKKLINEFIKKDELKTIEGQASLAKAMEDTIENGEINFIHAGKGIGRTYAYLLPVLKRVYDKNEKVVISTSTRASLAQLREDVSNIYELLKKYNYMDRQLTRAEEFYEIIEYINTTAKSIS